jgi:hypothetical protein
VLVVVIKFVLVAVAVTVTVTRPVEIANVFTSIILLTYYVVAVATPPNTEPVNESGIFAVIFTVEPVRYPVFVGIFMVILPVALVNVHTVPYCVVETWKSVPFAAMLAT